MCLINPSDLKISGFYDDDYEDFGFPSFGMRNRRGGGMNPMRGGRGGMGMGMADRRNMQPGSLYVSKTGHSVHMRGLPFQANDQDVFDVSLKTIFSRDSRNFYILLTF